jgi:hypothetical protein
MGRFHFYYIEPRTAPKLSHRTAPQFLVVRSQDALSAYKGIGSFYLSEMQFQAKWGIGFGPRDYCDYKNGISIIQSKPSHLCRLRMVAHCGVWGCRRSPLSGENSGLEPDIELRIGVSSKAISERIVTSTISRRPRSFATLDQ